MRALLSGLLVAWAACAGAATLSLYPDRSERDLLAAIDGHETWRSRVELGHWRPYGLPDVSLETLRASVSAGRLDLALGAVREEWGVLGAWRLRGRLLVDAGVLRLGLGLGVEGIRGAGRARELRLLISAGSSPSFSMLLPLGPTQRGGEGSGLLGAAWGQGDWVLRLWRGDDGPGLALTRGIGPLELELLARGESWQGFALSYRRRHWSLRFEERLHPWLGASHGLRLSLR